MEMKRFEIPSVKVVNFDCKDVITTSGEVDPVNPQPGDWDKEGTADPDRAKSIGGVVIGKVSWD